MVKVIDSRSNTKGKINYGDLLITDKGYFIVLSPKEFFSKSGGKIPLWEVNLINIETMDGAKCIDKLEEIVIGYKFTYRGEEITVKQVIDRDNLELVIR